MLVGSGRQKNAEEKRGPNKMATERNPTGTSVNNVVSIETAAEVLCMYPPCMYYFFRQKNSEGESAKHAHDAALWKNKKPCRLRSLQDKREIK